jgi:CheY-like chemotaxis protein
MDNIEKSRRVYMLEQDPDDREITEVISRETDNDVQFTFFHDTHQFFEGLSQTDLLPDIIVLDYNLAGGEIIGVLRRLKSTPGYLHIPVVVLSETASPSMVGDLYAHGAASLIIKPFTNNDTEHKISGFLDYWFRIVHLPSASAKVLNG